MAINNIHRFYSNDFKASESPIAQRFDQCAIKTSASKFDEWERNILNLKVPVYTHAIKPSFFTDATHKKPDAEASHTVKNETSSFKPH